MNAVVREFWSALKDTPTLVRLYFAPLVAVVNSIASGMKELDALDASRWEKFDGRPR